MRGCVIQSGVERPSEYQFERGCLEPLAGHSVEPTSSGSPARGWLWIIVVTIVLAVILIGVMR